MTKNRNNARIWGAGLEGGVFLAPKGSTPPTWTTDLTAPTTPWQEVGWLGEDGIDFEQATDSKVLKGWPGGAIMRKVTTSTDRTFKFMALEESALVMGLVHPGLTLAETSVGSDVFKGTVPASHNPIEQAGIFFFEDGAAKKGYVCPVVVIDLTSAVPHKFDEITAYEFTATTIGEYDVYFGVDGADFNG